MMQGVHTVMYICVVHAMTTNTNENLMVMETYYRYHKHLASYKTSFVDEIQDKFQKINATHLIRENNAKWLPLTTIQVAVQSEYFMTH